MSIQSELTRITNAVSSAYDSVVSKGGTVPAQKTVAGLANAIQSIPEPAKDYDDLINKPQIGGVELTGNKTLAQLGAEASGTAQGLINALDYTSPAAAATTSTTFIDTVKQTDGKISATKKTLPSASTSAKGIVQLSTATNSTSNTLAATASAVKSAYDHGGVQSVAGSTGAVTLSTIALLLYPVGSIYTTTDASFNPNTTFGGTWTLLKNKFLVGAGEDYDLGDTGGEAAHTLTVDEMPNHDHHQIHDGDLQITTSLVNGGSSFYAYIATLGSGSDLSTGYSGGGQPHNNLPPYQAVNMWRRTA